jgi:uncharacterized protein YjiS (DUF1127 family)
MRSTIRTWRQSRRYRNMLRELRSLSGRELTALGIPAAQIKVLAWKAATV